ncbi:phage tail assembly chaperone [Kozakia baliensis]|uniref:phage tail assembly chaperone n=1 Tax=Kozakia baliensis TaxID=153496 RepID=UPI00345BDA95
MAIKEVEVKIDKGDDRGKVFVVSSMPAFKADKWARHLVKALTRAGTQMPDDALKAGIAGLAGVAQTIFGYLDDDDADKAFDTLLECVQIRTDPQNIVVKRAVIEEDFEDAETLSLVRAEAFKLNVGFLRAAAFQISPLVAALSPREEQAPTA